MYEKNEIDRPFACVNMTRVAFIMRVVKSFIPIKEVLMDTCSGLSEIEYFKVRMLINLS